jgi:tetratricopeptide (TPR) repeat protein
MGIFEMSMINQMLKDLDSRQAKPSDSQEISADVRVSPSARRKLIKPVGLTLLAIAVAVVLFARLRQAQTAGPTVTNPVVLSTIGVIPAQSGPVVSAPSAPAEPRADSVPVSPTSVPTATKTSPTLATSSPTAEARSPTPTDNSPEKALQRWLTAYTAGDGVAYFKLYATDFVPPNGISYAKWKRQRSDFFARGMKPKIEISNVKIETRGAETQTRFHQSFRSPGYTDDVEKTLSWRIVDGDWLIVGESARPLAPPMQSPPSKSTELAGAQAVEATVRTAEKSFISKASNIKSVSPKQLSANLYRDAVTFMQDGRLTDAQSALTQALEANPSNHSARQMLADLMIDAGRRREAGLILSAGLSLAPGHSGFSASMARLHLASGAKQEALAILQQGLLNAGDDPEFHGFLAALLQTFGRHDEAIKHYLIALRGDPSMATWLVGIGISLRTQKKLVDSAEAFQRAIDTGELSVEVADFARQQIEQLRRSR